MISPTNAFCEACATRIKVRKLNEKPGICFPVEVSRLEQSLGHSVHECDKCHARYKLTGHVPGVSVGQVDRVFSVDVAFIVTDLPVPAGPTK
jgi:hypothetical protein